MNRDQKHIERELKITDETTKEVVKEILSYINRTYPAPALKNYFEPEAAQASVIASFFPDKDIMPMDLIQVYEANDHYAFLTMFFGPKAGFELSYKVIKENDINFIKKQLVHIASVILNGTLKIDMIASIYQLPQELQTEKNKAVLILMDPILRPTDLSIGRLNYHLIFAIDQKTYKNITNDKGQVLLDPLNSYLDEEIDKNPHMISGFK